MADYEKYRTTGQDDGYDDKAVSDAPDYRSSDPARQRSAPAGYDGECWPDICVSTLTGHD